ncbi:hypothetical protein [Caenimonas sp. SL110]|uniref:hypothetical protein n=1 Tax=Caenimonas sp. SL110 TaxID=1450524 RepID=UPI0006537811|nr:hypothetical protein [Caenimonas sp. SL110]
MTQGIGVATGLQDKFNWRIVVASAAGAGVGQAVGSQLGNSFGGRLTTRLIAGSCSGRERLDLYALSNEYRWFLHALLQVRKGDTKQDDLWQQNSL